MTEIVSHTSLTTHSGGFALAGGIYNATVSGTLAHGADNVELQRLANGQWLQLERPVRFSALDVNGTKATGPLPAGSYRWLVPGSAHNVNCSVTKVG